MGFKVEVEITDLETAYTAFVEVISKYPTPSAKQKAARIKAVIDAGKAELRRVDV